jgi:hypothetical protein
VLEKQPTGNYLPDVACEFLLSKADWFFYNDNLYSKQNISMACSISQFGENGFEEPTTLWLSQLREFDIDYLAGVEIVKPYRLEQAIAQGGGVKIVEQCVRYRIADLGI